MTSSLGSAALSVTVRPERSDDHDVVRDLVGAAFGGERVPRLLDGMRDSDAWVDLSFVAEAEAEVGGAAGAEVVGHLAYTRSLLDAPERLVEVLVLSPVSVRPDVQGRGVGKALVRASLERLAARPEPLVFLEGSPAYYSAFGFRAAGPLGFRRPSLRIPEPGFQVRPLTDDGTSESDGTALSGTLVYHRVFWDHDCVGLRE